MAQGQATRKGSTTTTAPFRLPWVPRWSAVPVARAHLGDLKECTLGRLQPLVLFEQQPRG